MVQHDPAPTLGQAVRPQVGALCYRMGPSGDVQVLLITSRDTGRWIIPKGWPMPDRSPAATAAREAFEEAGVEGHPAPVPVGTYLYTKALPAGAKVNCAVTVFALSVTRLCDRFPERAQRKRLWLPPAAAAARVQEPELADILRAFVPTAA